MKFTNKKLKKLQKKYKKAIKNGQTKFVFNKQELLVDYTKYLIEYMQSQLKEK